MAVGILMMRQQFVIRWVIGKISIKFMILAFTRNLYHQRHPGLFDR